MNARPVTSTGILSDLKFFFLHKPATPTLVEVTSETDRRNYNDRIMQRIEIDVAEYAILNVHKIGIEAPVLYVFEEMLKWDGDSTCWQNHVAEVEPLEGRLERIAIFLFGRRKYPFGLRGGFFGLKFIPLFNLTLVKNQELPGSSNIDNARFLLFESSGGYPIGHFAIYVRSSIATEEETESTQMFMLVGFNFYGDKKRSNIGIINRLWESIHNRVTSNIMNRFKQLCEWKFQRVQEGPKQGT
jgi:hypothetical protein